jgi:hypothetical protein
VIQVVERLPSKHEPLSSKKKFKVLGIKPRVLRMLGRHLTTDKVKF